MSLNDILMIERERVNREKIVFETIYERMKNRINNYVRVKSKDCIYKIPELIPGYPLVNISKTMIYLLKRLEREGFISFPINTLELYITWDPMIIRQMDEELKKHSDKYDKYNNQDSNKLNTSVKEFERANENIINFLVASKNKDRMKN
jgi:hypothetical protein